MQKELCNWNPEMIEHATKAGGCKNIAIYRVGRVPNHIHLCAACAVATPGFIRSRWKLIMYINGEQVIGGKVMHDRKPANVLKFLWKKHPSAD